MNGLTTVTTKGQVTIPEPIRRLLDVKVGDKVYFGKVYPEKKQVIIRLMPKNIANNLYGSLKSPVKFIDIELLRQRSVRALAKKYNLK